VFLPDGSRLAVTAGNQETLRLYDTSTWLGTLTLEGDGGALWPTMISPDGNVISGTILRHHADGVGADVFGDFQQSGGFSVPLCAAFNRQRHQFQWHARLHYGHFFAGWRGSGTRSVLSIFRRRADLEPEPHFQSPPGFPVAVQRHQSLRRHRPTLVLSNVTTNDSGLYRVRLSNAFEVVTTSPAIVQVIDRIMITSDPHGTNATNGANASFSVTALSPLPITYQWQFNGTNLGDGGSVSGSTTTNLSLTNVQLVHDGLYTVVASDAIGSVTSEPAALRILLKPVIVQAPLSQSVVAGGSVTFSVEITGNPAPFTYQWRQGSTTLTNMVLSEKKAFFTVNNLQTSQGGLYRVVITNAAQTALTLNATWNLIVLPDVDLDGLPDAWETAHGLSDALADADGDGLSNLAEYRSGTSPTNAASLLKLDAVIYANGQAMVGFQAASNQTYTVEWCAQPAGGAWLKLADVLARPNDRTESVTDSNAAAAARFYRVVTPRRP